MGIFWLVTAPADPTKEKTFEKLQGATRDVATVHKWDLPDLKVGTLDSLMELSDDLTKSDLQIEGMVHKIGDMTMQVYGSDSEKKGTADQPTINDMSVEQFTEKFTWEEGRFQKKSTLRDLVADIVKEVSKVDAQVKVQWTNYTGAVSQLSNLNRKAGGNLTTKSLHDIVKEEDFIKTEKLTTLLVVVPKSYSKDWVDTYETMAKFVVPRSSKVIAEDSDFQLWNVVLFENCVDEFTGKCKETCAGGKGNFLVRDYVFDKAALESSYGEKSKLQNQVENLRGKVLRETQTGFRVCYGNWMHLKAIRIFVESVLRYGLPANFMTMLLRPGKGKEDKLRSVLKKHYASLGTSQAFGKGADEAPADGEEFFPYVYLPIKTSAASAY